MAIMFAALVASFVQWFMSQSITTLSASGEVNTGNVHEQNFSPLRERSTGEDKQKVANKMDVLTRGYSIDSGPCPSCNSSQANSTWANST